jgi:hypothetical protein
MTNDAVECRGQIRPHGHELRRILREDRRHRVGRRVAVERPLAAHHLVEHGAEREHVGARVHRLAAHLLGRHVADGPHHGARIGHRVRDARRSREIGAAGLARQSKVENLHLPVVEQKDVLRLQVAVNQALAVRRAESAGDLHGDIDRLANGNRRDASVRRRIQPFAKRLPGQQFHDDVQLVLPQAGIENRHDVRGATARQRLALRARSVPAARDRRQTTVAAP